MHTESAPDLPPMLASEAAILAEGLLQKLETAENQGVSTHITRLGNGDFELDGLQFCFTKHETVHGAVLNLSAQVGYLPYTAETKEGRAALTQILQSAQRLRHARFKLDKHGHITLQSATELRREADDTDAIMALLAIYQEAGPLLQLIAKFL